jgi:hypothetical protein
VHGRLLLADTRANFLSPSSATHAARHERSVKAEFGEEEA